MKKQWHFASFLCLFVCVTLLFSYVGGRSSFLLADIVTKTTARNAPVIILDAGHGGEDGGATGVNGVLEKELNLSLSQKLGALLQMAGYTVIQTRTQDRLLCAEDTPRGHRKQGDLAGRLAIASEYPDGVFISLHMNTFPNDSCRGTQVWYTQNDAESIDLANAVQSRIKETLQPNNNRKVKAATSSIYLLRHATTRAILIECGFLSTPTECELLSSEAYQKALALSIFSAICDKIPCHSGSPVL